VSSNIVSLIIQYWYDHGTNQLKVVHVDTGEEVHFRNGSFLIRFFDDETTLVERVSIRHLASGREAYLQSGRGLQAFIRTCLLDEEDTPGTPHSETPGV
jgi:hypothetical protein